MPKSVGESPIAFTPAQTAAQALRKMLVASVAFGFLAGLAGTADARPRARDDDSDILRVKRPNPKKPDINKVEKKDPFAESAKGQLQLVVSIANQHVTLYSNGQRVVQGPVSTGMPGHPTPMGVFSIIEKDRYHHSNIYSGAPMPYMQRITWSGVALHEGALPGGPASHGCIRMSHDFAARLWTITKLGVRVIVARTDVIPVEFSHPNLFVPKPKAVEPPPVAAQEPVKQADQVAAIEVASVSAQRQAQVKCRAISDFAARSVKSHLRSFRPGRRPSSRSATGASFDNNNSLSEPAKPAVDEPPPPLPKASPMRMRGEPKKPSGHVAIFVSRKDKKLYVRQGFTPLFDAPIEITDPDKPLGTHVFTALELQDNGTKIRWNAMSMPAEQPRAEPRKDRERDRKSSFAKRKRLKPVVEVRQQRRFTPAQALDRIQIPQEAIDRIDEILVPGSSLVISDQGLGQETGKGTDFVVLTRNSGRSDNSVPIRPRRFPFDRKAPWLF